MMPVKLQSIRLHDALFRYLGLKEGMEKQSSRILNNCEIILSFYYCEKIFVGLHFFEIQDSSRHESYNLFHTTKFNRNLGNHKYVGLPNDLKPCSFVIILRSKRFERASFITVL